MLLRFNESLSSLPSVLTGEPPPPRSLEDDLLRSLFICIVLEVKLWLKFEAMSDGSIGVPGMFSFVILGPNILL